MRNEAENRVGRLVPRPHAAVAGTPYYDEELEVGQSKAHRIVAQECGAILAAVADEAGVAFLSDEPIWFLHPETDTQRVYYGDLVLARTSDVTRITADELLLVIEVVSVQDRRKELKDTRFQRLLNEYNGVPEFALAFPELEDARALTWCRLVDGEYVEHVVAPGGCVRSESVPGLELSVLPRERWREGDKLEIRYRGRVRPRLAEERARAEAERERAEAERERAEAERERAERLAERLRSLGVDPDET